MSYASISVSESIEVKKIALLFEFKIYISIVENLKKYNLTTLLTFKKTDKLQIKVVFYFKNKPQKIIKKAHGTSQNKLDY